MVARSSSIRRYDRPFHQADADKLFVGFIFPNLPLRLRPVLSRLTVLAGSLLA